MKRPSAETSVIVGGVLAALGATICCGLPLLLVTIGVGGVWVAQLMSMSQFYPVFVALGIGAFGFAFYRLYLMPAPACAPDGTCANPVTRRRQRIAFWVMLVPVTALLTLRFYAQWLV